MLVGSRRAPPVQRARTMHPPEEHRHQTVIPVQQAPSVLAGSRRAPPVQLASTTHPSEDRL